MNASTKVLALQILLDILLFFCPVKNRLPISASISACSCPPPISIPSLVSAGFGITLSCKYV
ncbi:hypothetical protein PF004_g11311 [Phytophthora fragariae]|nr:hypothetical protein PF004_g11311 [Phytophthora fragariae]